MAFQFVTFTTNIKASKFIKKKNKKQKLLQFESHIDPQTPIVEDFNISLLQYIFN